MEYTKKQLERAKKHANSTNVSFEQIYSKDFDSRYIATLDDVRVGEAKETIEEALQSGIEYRKHAKKVVGKNWSRA